MHSMRTERPRGFRLSGEIDISNETGFSSMLEAEVLRGGDITLDLTELRFMDSSGIRILLRMARELAGRGTLVVVGAREGLRRTFDMLGADDAPGLVIVDPVFGTPGLVQPEGRSALDLAGASHAV